MARGRLARAYLLLYNAAACALWAAAAARLATAPGGLGGAYAAAAPPIRAAQTLALAEIVHAAVGLGGGSPPLVAVQVLGRNLVLFGVLGALPAVAATRVAGALLAVWTAVEVVRYPYYLGGLVGVVPGALTWARYSAFLPLYPAGMAAEVGCYVAALPAIDAGGLYRVALPNAANFAFDFGTFVRAALPLYLYFGPALYVHMLRQRRRKLAA
ncbi:hypothetical protein BU14_0152s0038 [Porphyra umbilicalis]|uniref:very-long-chain (3R)-3-hydroxyacyl-CoA dehydratase n=1 Tax=Porphyra umbilicalis TaxID=2786 RepID=A0A1X6P9P8_PORUM|nr:hypothetical protein BU14_0152s0038 [Porphyra umbilicalis]|eukprot:OSX77343.1 hypothetical protein BU14_0152s0038 [Porphyra umbilicalis]